MLYLFNDLDMKADLINCFPEIYSPISPIGSDPTSVRCKNLTHPMTGKILR